MLLLKPGRNFISVSLVGTILTWKFSLVSDVHFKISQATCKTLRSMVVLMSRDGMMFVVMG